MKVAVLTHAGVLSVNRAVYRQLSRDGVEVHLVVPTQYASDNRILELEPAVADDPILHPLPLQGTNPRVYRFKGLTRVLDEIGPDIVHLDNEPNSRLALEAGLWCRRRRRRLTCLTCENLDFGWRDTVARRGTARGTALTLVKLSTLLVSRPQVAHLFAISNDGVELFRRHGFRSVSLIPFGFDPALFRPDGAARSELRSRLGWDAPVVAYFGRLTPEKGVHLLVRALAGLTDLNWRLVLDRFSPLTNDYAREVLDLIERTGLHDRTTYVEATHEEVGTYMRAADVVVVPSLSTPRWREQYGRVAPEAMASGSLVIAARSGTLPYLVGDGGLLFDEGDVAQLEGLLRQVLSDPARFSDIRERGTVRARHHLSVKQQADCYRNAFESLPGTGSP
jgi:glycosyltransferase involved in cell wall biosynthesis